jgi:2-oxoglutarate/2-oxoacid ferredoxin oxidoreductase subunit alpha
VTEETATLEHSTDTLQVEKVVIRLAGDSGDGMQLAGGRFTDASAAFGNDLATLPVFPAEIRAPAGTLPGVSSFQVQIADFDILTAGDQPDCLVAMNPAALKSNLADLRENGTLIVNEEAFEERNLAKAGYSSNPLTDGSLAGYKVIQVPMERLTKEAVADSGVSGRDVLRSKNFFALGLLAWLFNRPQETTLDWITAKFKNKLEVAKANELAFKAGYTFGFATEATRTTYMVKPAQLEPGTYTQITGNTALAWGLIAAAQAAASRSSTGPTRSPLPPTSSMSCRSTRTSACARSRPRTRSPVSARRSAPPSAGPWPSPGRPDPVSRSRARRSRWRS